MNDWGDGDGRAYFYSYQASFRDTLESEYMVYCGMNGMKSNNQRVILKDNAS